MDNENKESLRILKKKYVQYGDITVARGLAYLFRGDPVKIKKEDVPKFLEELGVEVIHE